MTNSYADTIALGQEAYYQDEARQANPYIFHTTPWFAWDCGWLEAQREANPRPSEPDLNLEASLVAWQDSVSR